MSIKGVIFDMDGTITEPYFDFVNIKEETGTGDVDLLDYLRTASDVEYERVHAIMQRFEDMGVANAKLNDGARELLDELSRRGLPTALLTRNTRRSVDGVCRKLKLNFDISITREDGPYKPAPEPIWEIARRWGAKPHEVLMVGDYKWDVLCAKNAGTPCALLIDGDEEPEWANGVEFRLKSLLDVIDIISANHRRDIK